MAAIIVDGGSSTVDVSTHPTMPAPSLPSGGDGDLMVLIIASRPASGPATTFTVAGWTYIGGALHSIGRAPQYDIYARQRVGADSAPTIVPGANGGAGDEYHAAIVAISGASVATLALSAPSEGDELSPLGPITSDDDIPPLGAILVFIACCDERSAFAPLAGDGLSWSEGFESVGATSTLVVDNAENSSAVSAVSVSDKSFEFTGEIGGGGPSGEWIGSMLVIGPDINASIDQTLDEPVQDVDLELIGVVDASIDQSLDEPVQDIDGEQIGPVDADINQSLDEPVQDVDGEVIAPVDALIAQTLDEPVQDVDVEVLLDISGIDRSIVEDIGGDVILITGGFSLAAEYAVDLIGPPGVDTVTRCYSGKSGFGTRCKARSLTKLGFVVPALPLGSYDVRVTQGALEATLEDALAVVPHNFRSTVHGTRVLIPARFALGVRSVDLEAAQTVYEAIVIGAIANTPASQGVPFSLVPTLTNDTPFSALWSLASGTLPDGLALDETTGEISGTPTTVQTEAIVLRATTALSIDDEAFEIAVT